MTIETPAMLAARHEAERVKNNRNMSLSAALPFTPDTILETSTGAPWIIYRGRTLAEAVAMFAAFQIAPMYKLRGRYVYLAPVETVKDESATVEDGPFAAAIGVEQGQGYGPTAKLWFYAMAGDETVRVIIDIKGPDYIGGFSALRPTVSESYSGKTSRSSVIRRAYGANPLLNGLCDNVVSWGGGGPIADSAKHDYLICADDDAVAIGSDHTHAAGQMANIVDATARKDA